MSAQRLTRRSLLAVGAGGLAGAVVRPHRAFAALVGSPSTVVSDRALGELRAGVRTIELTRVADLLGVQWAAGSPVGLQMRFRTRAGSWSRWVDAGPHGHGPDGTLASGIGEPIWTGGTRAVQLRSAAVLEDVRLHLVDVSGGVGARRLARADAPLAILAASLPTAAPVLAAGAGQPPIIARSAWARGVAHPRVAPGYGAVSMAFVHHTENPNGYSAGEVPAMLRAIFAFHRYVNGWNDIGYNFVIDRFGRVFEARAGGIDEPVVGAHAGGYNLVSTGVAVLGSFMSVPISAPSRAALERLLAWKLSLHGTPARGHVVVRVNPAGAVYSRYPANARVSLPRIAGHRDGDSTDCPGNVLYGELGGVRTAVARLAGRPVKLTLALTPAAPPAPAEPPPPGATAPAEPAPPPAEPAPTPATLGGALTFLDGTPIPGAPIVIQRRVVSRRGEAVQEQPLAQLVSDAQGSFSTPASFPGVTGKAWLRALHPASGSAAAGVSQPLLVSL